MAANEKKSEIVERAITVFEKIASSFSSKDKIINFPSYFNFLKKNQPAGNIQILPLPIRYMNSNFIFPEINFVQNIPQFLLFNRRNT